jgi:DNA-binding response OmpR family regulator
MISERPRKVTWNGRHVGLSPIQAEIFALIAARGRASFDAIDCVIREFGASPQTRAVQVLRIRRKFKKVGALDPFERIGNTGYRLVVESDESRSMATVAGLQMRL